MKKVFLKAEWRKLVLANYVFDEAILKKYLPAKTELDTWKGEHYVSLVGFLFKNTRIKDIAVPFHRTFEEVNIRFYVRYKEDNEWRRGVVFIREIVPKSMIAFVANTLYREHYVRRRMSHEWKEQGDKLSVHYSWGDRSFNNILSVNVHNKAYEIAIGSEEEFITEHYYGYSRFDEHRTGEYKVTHPRWNVYPTLDYSISCDFEKNYGPDFKSLNEAIPLSVYLAEGSNIEVYDKVLK